MFATRYGFFNTNDAKRIGRSIVSYVVCQVQQVTNVTLERHRPHIVLAAAVLENNIGEFRTDNGGRVETCQLSSFFFQRRELPVETVETSRQVLNARHRLLVRSRRVGANGTRGDSGSFDVCLRLSVISVDDLLRHIRLILRSVRRSGGRLASKPLGQVPTR